ncbi:MAG: ABC transporter ATP-binding protein [Clostridiales bacterium]|nr:ABC transporter ATP-binding protein [Clostridiales bacterium]
MDQIVLNHVTKRFTTKTLGTVTAVGDFCLNVKEGECFSFLGPSGCGKTTTLRMIAGFEDLSEGEIYLGGKPMSIRAKNLYVPPEERGLGMVFQAFAVWPHMNIFDNVAFPLKVQKRPRAEIRERVAKALKHCSLDGMENVFPSDLSGGQQQRIALARAIVTNPKVMLLDEPLSNLDPKLRESMSFEIKKLQKEFNFTIIFVTHDQSEAMALSDRMLVMDMGKVVQTGTPTELYNKPVSRFVHSFLGQSNFTDVDIIDGRVYPKGDHSQPLGIAPPAGGVSTMALATRPNTIDINHEEGYQTKVLKRAFLTDFTEYIVAIGNQALRVQTPHRNMFRAGDSCYLRFPNPIWYESGKDAADAERERRTLV